MDLNNFKTSIEAPQNSSLTNGNKSSFEKNLLKNRSSSFIGNKLPQPPALQNSLLTPVPSSSIGSFSNHDSISYGSRSSKGSHTTLFPEYNLLSTNNVPNSLMPLQNNPTLQFGQQPLPGLKFSQQPSVLQSNPIKPLKHSFQAIQFNNPFQQRENLAFNNASVHLIQRDRSTDSSSSNLFFKQDFSPLLKQSFEAFNQQPHKKISDSTKHSFSSSSRFSNEIFNQTSSFENYNIKYEIEKNVPRSSTYLHKKKVKPRPKCELCNKTFSRQSSLKTHITTVHKKIKKYECPYDSCNKRFSTNSNMRRHVRIHEKNDALNIQNVQSMDT